MWETKGLIAESMFWAGKVLVYFFRITVIWMFEHCMRASL